ncbi:MAG: hypothetical protein Q4D79_03655 [Propionibacteriaceae bacterium]|nr:hypothetical protein [Propionibacteriaceae bacterium]
MVRLLAATGLVRRHPVDHFAHDDRDRSPITEFTTLAISAEHLTLFVLSLAGWWATVPQVARMLCGPSTDQEHKQRRAAVVEAARRLAAITP